MSFTSTLAGVLNGASYLIFLATWLVVLTFGSSCFGGYSSFWVTFVSVCFGGCDGACMLIVGSACFGVGDGTFGVAFGGSGYFVGEVEEGLIVF